MIDRTSSVVGLPAFLGAPFPADIQKARVEQLTCIPKSLIAVRPLTQAFD